MQVRVLYFGVLKELLKRDGERIELPVEASVGTLLDAVSGGRTEGGDVWKSLAVAVNREYADADWALHEGDEVALLPPVSGGVGDAGPSTSLRFDSWDTTKGPEKGNRRSFDYATHDRAVGSFAQDDTSFQNCGTYHTRRSGEHDED